MIIHVGVNNLINYSRQSGLENYITNMNLIIRKHRFHGIKAKLLGILSKKHQKEGTRF